MLSSIVSFGLYLYLGFSLVLNVSISNSKKCFLFSNETILLILKNTNPKGSVSLNNFIGLTD